MGYKGFSLVELNICCVIVAILACAAIPYFGKMQQTRTLHKEIRELYGNLQQAKVEAIKTNSFVVFKTTPKGYQIFVDNGNGGAGKGDWNMQPHERQLVNHTYSDGITLHKTTFTGQRTRFNGRVCMKAGRVILQNNEGAKTELVVSTLGRFRVEKL